MKVLIINGSPRANGNTDIALREMEKVFAEEGVETKRLNIGTQMIHGCVACNACHRTGKCGFDDVVNRAADGVQQRRAAARDILPFGQRLDPPDVDAVVDDLALVGEEHRRNKRFALSGLLPRNHRIKAANRVLF